MMIYPPGKRLQKTMERSTMLSMGKLTISMVIFNSYVSHYQMMGEQWLLNLCWLMIGLWIIANLLG